MADPTQVEREPGESGVDSPLDALSEAPPIVIANVPCQRKQQAILDFSEFLKLDLEFLALLLIEPLHDVVVVHAATLLRARHTYHAEPGPMGTTSTEANTRRISAAPSRTNRR